MRGLIEFRPGVFARAGEVVYAPGDSACEWTFDGGVWDSECMTCAGYGPPPELRSLPTETRHRDTGPAMGWDWEGML